jgi:hypothetical protein
VTRQDYIRAVLELYRGLPHTPARRRPSPADRRLAEQLFERHVPLTALQTACYLAIARRTARPPEAPPLQTIRSLAYFMPLIDEVLLNPPPTGYLRYLRDKLDLKVQISTVFEER